MEASPGVGNLYGHVAPKFKLPGMRDTGNAREFIKEFDESGATSITPIRTSACRT